MDKPHDIIDKIRILVAELSAKKHTGKIRIELDVAQGAFVNGRVVREDKL